MTAAPVVFAVVLLIYKMIVCGSSAAVSRCHRMATAHGLYKGAIIIFVYV